MNSLFLPCVARYCGINDTEKMMTQYVEILIDHNCLVLSKCCSGEASQKYIGEVKVL